MIHQLQLFSTLKEEIRAMPNGIVPRDYQRAALEKTFDLFAGGSKGVILRAATGTGKTICGCMIADRWLKQSPKNRVIVLTHEIQLLDQFAEEIEDVLSIKPLVEQGQFNKVKPENLKRGRIVVASRATLYEKEVEASNGQKLILVKESRLHKFDPITYNWLVCLDEIHRYHRTLKSCRHILEWFERNPESRRLGLTATPERGDKKSLRSITPDVAADYMLYDVDGGPCAVADGWAVAYDQRFIVVDGVDFKNLKTVAGDFDEEELEAVLTAKKQLAALVTPMLDIVGDRQTLIFSATVAMAKKVAAEINGRIPGSAKELDGASPPWQRNSVYGGFEKGDFQFLSVCGLCREGYNNPSCGAVAVFRPTQSRPLAEQMKGRGCRPLRGCVNSDMTREERLAAIAASEKPACVIVDLVGVSGFGDCATTAHILASGKDDEVIERANENALEKSKTGPVDMGQEIRRAQKEIDEEREIARQRRLVIEKHEQREAERLAKIETEVRYTAHTVQQGHGSRAPKEKRRARLLWGKYKGKLVEDVPDWYLKWVEPKIKQGWLRAAVQGEIAARKRAACGSNHKKKRLAARQLASAGLLRAAAQDVPGHDKAKAIDDINRLLDEACYSRSVK